MSILRAVLVSVGAAAVGYGAYKGVQYLNEKSSELSSEGINALIEQTRAEAGAHYADLDEAVVPDATPDGALDATAA